MSVAEKISSEIIQPKKKEIVQTKKMGFLFYLIRHVTMHKNYPKQNQKKTR